MAAEYRVGVIGAGRPWRTEGATGFGMSHAHMQGYVQSGRCKPVAVSDIKEENARAFVEQYGMERHYLDYREMLRDAKLDIVSIATWPHLHAPMVIDAANAGVKAIHCEKPMAPTWGEARAMVEACSHHGVQLTFNHQRRFLEPFRKAREIAKSGALGEIRRIEAQCGDMFDWGTHWIDMIFFYNDETPAEWVIAQIDCRQERKVFGVDLENQALCLVKFTNGVRGYLETGFEAAVGCANRIIGTEGVVEVHDPAPHVRVRAKGDPELHPVELSEGLHGGDAVARGVIDLVQSLDTVREPELSGHRALRATEVIMAAYESSRRRGRVDLPLTVDDNAFHALLEAGEIGPGACEPG